jgi:AraC-like DNA-binding protein
MSAAGELGAYGDRLGARLRVEQAPALLTRGISRPTLAITELRADHPQRGMSEPLPREAAFLVGLQLRDYPEHRYQEDGRMAPLAALRAGEVCIYDLQRDPRFEINNPFWSVHFYVPCSALDEVTDDAGPSRVQALAYRPGQGVADPTVQSLVAAVRPALAAPQRANALFIDGVALALVAHVAQTYGTLRPAARDAPAGLAAWQERRAKEFMLDDLAADLSMAEVASRCGLSPGHFARAFRASTGLPPHRWRLQRRVAKARDLLRSSTDPLVEIALKCGFADQSHFTKTFTRLVGLAPGAWRRRFRS